MLFEYQVVYKTMNVLPENARQFAKLKVNGIGLRILLRKKACQPSERNEIFHSRSLAVCLFLPYIQSSISFEYSNNTFYLTIKLTISSMDFTENDPDITT